MPFKGYRITSPYGLRTDPITGAKNTFHDGIDIVKSHKAPIEAFVGGKVLYAGDGVTGTGVGGYGNVVVIEDKNKRAHVYAHLDSVSVKKGQTVKQGDVIGKQGATGKRVTGSHLHYEVRKKSSPSLGWIDDAEARTLDPTEYLKEFYAADKTIASNKEYIVKAGDNLIKIAKTHDTTVEALVKLNTIKNKNLIVVGQKIKLPDTSKQRTLKVGSKVKVKSSAKKYATGQTIPSWVKGKTYTLQQVKTDRVLLDEIMSWIHKSDIE